MLKNLLLSLTLALGASALMAQTQIATGEHPEAIVSDGTQLYVGNFGPGFNPAARDSNGYIARLSLEGEVLQPKFITGLHAPKGMCIDNGVLYLTDIYRVLGFDLANGSEVFRYEVDSAKFLNDITIRESNWLYFTDSGTGTVYELDIQRRSLSVLDQGNTGGFTNGIFYCPAEQRLYVVSGAREGAPSKIGFFPYADQPYTLLSDRQGSYDGVSALDAQHLLLTDWQDSRDNGTVLKIDRQTGEISPYPHIKGLEGAADFYYHAPTKQVYVPYLVGSKIVRWDLEPK